MGTAESKYHQKNAELIKLRKKYDITPIKEAKLIHIWVIGGIAEKLKELASVVANRYGYLLITESDLLDKEAKTNTDRGHIIHEILQGKGLVSWIVISDLIKETLLDKLKDMKGVVFAGSPKCKSQARSLEKIVGPVSLIIFMKWSQPALESALQTGENYETKKKIEDLKKTLRPLVQHKKTIAVDAEAGASACLNQCSEKLSQLVDSQT